MNWDVSSLRQLILSLVKPLKSGKSVSQSGTNATLDNLFPEGSDSDFRHTSPFGFISRVPVGITAFYDALFGSGYENIILGHLHTTRPIPAGVGETVVYSTTVNGNTVKASITLKNDGKILVVANQDIEVSSTGTVKISAATKVQVLCEHVELGSGALEKVVNGETFLDLYNQHVHFDSFGLPTSPPQVPMVAATHLSAIVKAAK